MKNGKTFDEIAFVKGAGNSLEQQDYSYADPIYPTGKLYYYRLRQIDEDGQFVLSNTISVREKQGLSKNFVYPNPTKDKLNLDISEDEILSGRIIDFSGKYSSTYHSKGNDY